RRATRAASTSIGKTTSSTSSEERAMPEGPEIETERLHEAIHEELEKEGETEGGGFLKRIALSTAILAALAAIAALYAGAKAKEKEKERDERSTEADHLLHRHHLFADTVALLQVSIALGAVAALTRSRPVWLASMLVGLAGIGLGAYTFLR